MKYYKLKLALLALCLSQSAAYASVFQIGFTYSIDGNLSSHIDCISDGGGNYRCTRTFVSAGMINGCHIFKDPMLQKYTTIKYNLKASRDRITKKTISCE